MVNLYLPLMDKVPDIPDANLAALMKSMRPILEKAGEEANYTGDRKYFNQLRGFYSQFAQEKNRRWQLKHEGDKIVTKAGKVQRVLDTSAMEEDAEVLAERKKREEEQRQKEEEEKRKKEEEEKKRLEEEAKRQEELVKA